MTMTTTDEMLNTLFPVREPYGKRPRKRRSRLPLPGTLSQGADTSITISWQMSQPADACSCADPPASGDASVTEEIWSEPPYVFPDAIDRQFMTDFEERRRQRYAGEARVLEAIRAAREAASRIGVTLTPQEWIREFWKPVMREHYRAHGKPLL